MFSNSSSNFVNNVSYLFIFVLLCLKLEKVQSITHIYVHFMVLFNGEFVSMLILVSWLMFY